MKQNSTIDNIFKKGFNKTNFTTREKMWQQMEKQLDKKAAHPAVRKPQNAAHLFISSEEQGNTRHAKAFPISKIK